MISLNSRLPLIVILCLVGGIAFQSFWIVSLSAQNNSLQDERTSLQAQLSELQNLYDTLEASYSILQSSYSILQSNYSILQGDYTCLDEEYNSLNNEYSKLKNDYDSLQDNYQSLLSLYMDYQSVYDHLLSTLDLRWHHPNENEKLLITPYDPAVTQIVFQITGGWSDPSDWNEYWDDLEAMYNWVVDNIEYRYDGLFPILPENPLGFIDYFDEMWQFPNETLTLRTGDCDDMAILLASMILSYNDCEYIVECVVTEHHVALYFPVADDKICILDPAGHYTTNSGWPYYDLTAKNIRQEIYDWLNYMDESQVEWVFSNELWKQFTNTEEFINWLYAR